MDKSSKSEQMLGNTRAKQGEHESIVLRLPVAIVDGLYKCLAAEATSDGLEFEISKRDVLDHALSVLFKHIEKQIGIEALPLPLHFHLEDEEALKLLSPEK